MTYRDILFHIIFTYVCVAIAAVGIFGDIIPVYVYLYFRHLISWGLMVLDHNNVTRI